MKPITAIGEISSGKLKLYRQNEFKKAIALQEDCQIELKLIKKHRYRSSGQNRYYWGVIIPIFKLLLTESQGRYYNDEQTHEFLKSVYNYDEILIERTGEVVKIPHTTTDKNTVEFEEYQEKCRNGAYEMFGVMIPLPNEQLEIF